MMVAKESNGNGVFKWIAGTVVSVAIVVIIWQGGTIIQAQNAKVETLDKRVTEVKLDTLSRLVRCELDIKDQSTISRENHDAIVGLSADIRVLTALVELSVKAQGVSQLVIDAAKDTTKR